jgi:uncharacterized repeat protein (TIGR03837 family)
VRSPGAVWLVATHGTQTGNLRSLLEKANAARKPGGKRRQTEIIEIPFLEQDRYDQLLWACDVNFVRGEDSFVRAQWAGRPLAWNIYPTDDGAHWVKLSAFLARYTEGLEPAHADAITRLWEAWNRRWQEPGGDRPSAGLADAWAAFVARREAFEPHARAWAQRLAAHQELAAALVDFAGKLLVK